MREKAFEFGVELPGEGFIVAQDEGGALIAGDDIGDGEGFSGAGDAEEDLVHFAIFQAAQKLSDSLGLVALGREVGDELEVHEEKLTKFPDGRCRLGHTYTAKRKYTISPSCISYSRPWRKSRPAALAPSSPPYRMKSS
jgi:hypothetical protein